MTLSSYHVHTDFCDGAATAEDMILQAIECGMTEVGFSGHSPIPGEEDWCMSLDGALEYRRSLSALKEKYKDKIKVYAGIEQDVLSTTPTAPYDYVIGSVHGFVKNGGILAVDVNPERIREAISLHYGGDPYLYVEEYFREVSEVYLRTHCDIIAHFDLVAKFVECEPLFSTSHPRYLAARDKALDKLLLTPALFEINTGAISRGYRTTPYPEETVIELIAASGKPFVISSDAHTKETLDFGIEAIARELSKKGIKYVTSLDEILSITRA